MFFIKEVENFHCECGNNKIKITGKYPLHNLVCSKCKKPTGIKIGYYTNTFDSFQEGNFIFPNKIEYRIIRTYEVDVKETESMRSAKLVSETIDVLDDKELAFIKFKELESKEKERQQILRKQGNYSTLSHDFYTLSAYGTNNVFLYNVQDEMERDSVTNGKNTAMIKLIKTWFEALMFFVLSGLSFKFAGNPSIDSMNLLRTLSLFAMLLGILTIYIGIKDFFENRWRLF